MGSPPIILKLISGVRIPLASKPNLIVNWKNSRFSTVWSPQMSQEIELLKEQKVVERPPHPGPSFISRMFLVQKSSGGLRPIFDLRGLNRHVKVRNFRLFSHLKVPDFLQDGDWMTRIDMSLAFLHVPIADSHRCLLRFVYNKELFQWTSLPFGLSAAPHIFATITNWIAEILRSRGMRVVVNLDDFLLVSQDRSKLMAQILDAVKLLEFLGWRINRDKCVLEPCQKIEFLGILWNTKDNLMSLPQRKAQRILDLSQRFISRGRCSLKELQCLLGQLNFANFVTHRGRLHCRHLQRFLTNFRQHRPRQTLAITRLVTLELMWWQSATSAATLLHKPPITNFLTTDAADTGWGAQLDSLHLSGPWSKTQKNWHSNKKEMFAVHAAIEKMSHRLQSAHILLQTDNRTLVAYIQKEGGTRSLQLLNLTYQLLHILDRNNITLSAVYLPGRYNGIADRLSRGKPLPEWHLLPHATKGIFAKWGKPDVDFFASAGSTVVERYVSRDCSDQHALFTDAFSQTWHCKLGWLFPPPCLIPRVLAHLNKCKGEFLLVAPNWEQTFWMSDLSNRSREQPLTIQNLETALIDTTTNQPPQEVERLTLQVWRIGCGRT